MKKYFSLWAALLCLFGQRSVAWAEDFQVSSPDEQLCVTVHLTDGCLTYEVFRDERRLVDSSPLGLVTEEADLSRFTSDVSETP